MLEMWLIEVRASCHAFAIFDIQTLRVPLHMPLRSVDLDCHPVFECLPLSACDIQDVLSSSLHRVWDLMHQVEQHVELVTQQLEM